MAETTEPTKKDMVVGLIFFALLGALAVIGIRALRIGFLPGYLRSDKSFGNTEGSYKKITSKYLEAHKIDLVGQRVDVEFQLWTVDIQTKYGRLNLSPVSVDGVDVLIDSSNPMYDQIVEYDPKLIQKFRVYGLVKAYGNSIESVYLEPSGISFD